MFVFLRAFLSVFVAAQFLMPGTAEAQSHPTFYARILMDDDVQKILHCPLCSYPVSDGQTFFVRTEEGLNVAFTDASTAVGVVELLNLMAYAQDRCDRTQYELALDEYAKMMGLGDKHPSPAQPETDGVFGLLQPRRDLSALTEVVVPPFHRCGRTVSAMRK